LLIKKTSFIQISIQKQISRKFKNDLKKNPIVQNIYLFIFEMEKSSGG
jgi:hypothetical protein